MADEKQIKASVDKLIFEMMEEPYVVENLKTGEKYIAGYEEAIKALHFSDSNSNPYFDIWHSVPNPDIKIYSVKSLGPAGEVLYGRKKP